MLFVPEDEPISNDDPVITTIPVHLTKNSLKPLLLQFPTKAVNSQLVKQNLDSVQHIQYKPKSNTIELELPIQKDRYFSQETADRVGAASQVLRGVIINNNSESKLKGSDIIKPQPGTTGGSSYYLTVLNSDGLHLTPLEDTTMLRPHFAHIDATKIEKPQESVGKAAKINVVTMTATSARESSVPRLGGALLSAKLENEEDGVLLDVKKGGLEPFIDKSGKRLTSNVSEDEYLDRLLDSVKL
ncbi:DNA-directed RNA polymerase III subunit C37 [Martiniozyma asiatica (nom. inval.)]|nr:DNA-directed RNA polymerase III subunit C37 [Martiniozyma asiatica]